VYSSPFGILAVESERRHDERRAAERYRLVQTLMKERPWRYRSLVALSVSALLTLIVGSFRT